MTLPVDPTRSKAVVVMGWQSDEADRRGRRSPYTRANQWDGGMPRETGVAILHAALGPGNGSGDALKIYQLASTALASKGVEGLSAAFWRRAVSK